MYGDSIFYFLRQYCNSDCCLPLFAIIPSNDGPICLTSKYAATPTPAILSLHRVNNLWIFLNCRYAVRRALENMLEPGASVGQYLVIV